MNTSVKTLASAALVAALVGGLQSSAKATNFEPLGEGVLPSGKFVQDFKFTLYPGEAVPWHYHPGRIYGVIVSGTLTEEKGCGRPADTITAGSAFTEAPGAIHRVFNYGTEPVEIVFTFIVPPRYAGYTGTIYVNGPRCGEGGELLEPQIVELKAAVIRSTGLTTRAARHPVPASPAASAFAS